MPDCLSDSNVLIRASDPLSPLQQQAVAAVLTLRSRGYRLCITPQNVIELWAVMTRPRAANGLGMTVAVARQRLMPILEQFYLLPDTPAVFTHWLRLVTAHGVQGKQVHDARLVAVMAAHGVSTLLTFNTADFTRYPGLTVLHPSAV